MGDDFDDAEILHRIIWGQVEASHSPWAVHQAGTRFLIGVVLGVLLYLVPWTIYLILPLIIGALLLDASHANRSARNAGWYEGRSTMVQSMLEANARGANMGEWVVSESARDVIYYVENCATAAERRQWEARERKG